MSAILRAAKFGMFMYADGSATQFEVLMASSPIWFIPPDTQGDFPQSTFDLTVLHPSDVVDVTSTVAITSADITTLGTKIKVVFTSAPTAGIFTVFGTFLF